MATDYSIPKEEYKALKAENAKLRESVRNLLTCIKHEECEESCPHYEPMYNDYGYEKNGSIVVESEYLGCCAVGLENCDDMLFDTDEYLRELGNRGGVMDGELVNDILSSMCEEIDSAQRDIENYEDGGIDKLVDNFSDYAKLRGFVWGMRRAIFLLKYRAEKAGIEVE